ncbi:MAG: ABC transporter ATP-binding protein/permease [Anaerolineae bacterium]|nr:ABC transporter ATP-binding protein/permease [Anaerolineae bacterium]
MKGASVETGKAFDWEVTRRIGGYLKPYKKNIVISLIGMALAVLSTVAGPPIIGLAVDEGLKQNNFGVVIWASAGYLVLQAAGFVGLRLQIYIMAVAGQGIIQTLRDQLFTHIQRLPLAFFSTYETGRIIARIIGDVNVLREAISFAVIGALRDMFIVLGMIVTMLLLDPALTVVSIAVVVLLSVLANYWRIYARKAYIKVRETNADVNAELAENINGIRVVKAYSREKYNLNRFKNQINRSHLDANLEATRVASLFFPSIDLVGGIATGTLIYIGGTMVLNRDISVGNLITFVLYVEQFFFPIRQIAMRYNTFQATMAAGEKIFWLLDRPVEIKDSDNAVPLPPIEGHIQFEDVSLSYSKDDYEALTHVDLDVPAGSTVALVGHTGAGKTSMVKLLSRFYDPSGGRVLVDGYNIQEVTLDSLRSQMGVVLQQPFLFAGTIMDNIRYGRLDATDDQIIEAAKAVGAHEFIVALENGYQTEVAEGGVSLSVGQRQLLSFARALLADPRILILDEATSSIDTRTEQVIQQALKRLLKGRTSFVIAHRLSTITSADIIVVMDHGKVIEVGSHHELLQRKGAYYHLYSMTYAA